MTEKPHKNRVMGATDWGLLLLLSVLWGGSFFFVGVAVKELPTFTIVVCRVGLAALILWLLIVWQKKPLPSDPFIWLAFVGMGFLNNALPFSLIAWGQAHIASGLASILNAMTPLFGVVVAHLLTKDEKLTGPRLLGVLLGIAGVAFMIGLDTLAGLGVHILAQVAVLAAALSYAFAGVFGRRFAAAGVSPMVAAAGQVTGSTLLLLPLTLVIDQPWNLAVPGSETVLALIGVALFSTSLGYILYFRLLSTAGPTNLLLVTFLIPVSAIMLGWLVLDEQLSWHQGLGMALIGLGLAAIDGRPLRFLSRAA
jgi:drug/metabolite transporter (DMT)-like permease